MAYVVRATDEMIDNEISRLQNRYGNMKDRNQRLSERPCIECKFRGM